MSYSSRLLSDLSTLRQQNDLCDVHLASDADHSQTMAAHKVVLAAASPYFAAMFRMGLRESESEVVVIRDISADCLRLILDFVYSGERDVVNADNVQELMVAADMLDVHELVEVCTQVFVDLLECGNAIGMLGFATQHNCFALRNHVLKFVHENFVGVADEAEFVEMNVESVRSLISSEHLIVDSEHQVLVAALRWIKYDIEQRRRFVFELMKLVRLSLVPTKLLEELDTPCPSLNVALRTITKDVSEGRCRLCSPSRRPRVGAKKTILIIGGSQRELKTAWTKTESLFQTVEAFDAFSNTWISASPMRTGRILPGVAVVGRKVYVCGGEAGPEILRSGECYDPVQDAWTNIAPLTVRRCEFGMCALNNYIYAFGGWVGEDIGGSIERYDPNLNIWTLVGNMPEQRFSMGTVAHNNKIYLVGGCTHSRNHMQELVAFDPETHAWHVLANMLEPRSQMGCAVLSDHLYVVGGTNRHNQVLRGVERYSFQHDRWEAVANMEEPRASPAAAAANGKLYVFGGDQINEVNFYRARTTIANCEVFDPVTGKWSRSPALPESRAEAGVVVV